MIKFTRDTRPNEGADYKAGETLEASPASEFRWLKRNAAVECDPPIVEEPEPELKQKAKARPKRAAKNKG